MLLRYSLKLIYDILECYRTALAHKEPIHLFWVVSIPIYYEQNEGKIIIVFIFVK